MGLKLLYVLKKSRPVVRESSSGGPFWTKIWTFVLFPSFRPQIFLTLCGTKEQSKRGRRVQYELQNLPKTQFHEKCRTLGENRPFWHRFWPKFDFFLFLSSPIYFLTLCRSKESNKGLLVQYKLHNLPKSIS